MEPLPNFDRRAVLAVPRGASPSPQETMRLRERLPAARVDFDPRLGTVTWVRAERGFLTGPGGLGHGISARAATGFAYDDPHRPTKIFLREYAALFGHGPEVLENAKIGRDFTTPHNGLRTVVWEQQLAGIPVYAGTLISHTSVKGELVSLSSHFVPNPGKIAQTKALTREDALRGLAISARRAVAFAAQNLGLKVEASEVTPVSVTANPRQAEHFQAEALNGAARVGPVWLPEGISKLRLCWEVVLTSRQRSETYRVLIDGETGEAMLRHSLTEYLSPASYRVFVGDSPTPLSPACDIPCTMQPPLVERVLVTLSAGNTNASPNGWVDDDVNETRGNNVLAHTDRNFDDKPDLPRPQGEPFRVFDFPLDLAQAPLMYTNASVTDLFYWCNWMHDRLYALGFTEAAGNFQTTNFGRGGWGDDALLADAQDGGGFNNANMTTPSDGSPPRLQVFRFIGPNPDRDGVLDHEVVLHEYAHGLSNRRVGGGVGLSELQSRGLGEGWSDWYALALLSQADDDAHGVYAAGAYAAYQLNGLAQNYYFGIRRYPYSTDLSRNPLTFKDIDPAQAGAHPNIPRNPTVGGMADEIHNQGEVWCVTLWDARANLIKRHGFEIGNELMLQLVTDGLNLSPANPNFLQARDAILQADLVNNGGANLNLLWAAFAKRGMGYSAISPPSSATDGLVEAFDLPDALSITPADGFTSTGPVGGPFNPVVKSFTVMNIGADAVQWSVTSDEFWMAVAPAGGMLEPGESNAVTVSLGAPAGSLASGLYTNEVRFNNETSGRVQTRKFVLRSGQADYFTERFDAADHDLACQTLTFTPDGSPHFYAVCREPASQFPTDPAGGIALALEQHSYLQLTTPEDISLYGHRTNVVFLASEGHLTLGAPDTSGLNTLANHFSRPRVAASFAHLHPDENGGAVYWQQLTDRVAITFSNAWEYSSDNYNDFQVELFYDGRIRMTQLKYDSAGGLVGLSRGLGTPGGFLESDLSEYGPCALPLHVVLPDSAVEGGGVQSAQVNIYFPTATNLTVNLESSDASLLLVTSNVLIPAGQATAQFDLSAVNNWSVDGPRWGGVLASAAGFASISNSILVLDDEDAALGLTLGESQREGTGIIRGILQTALAATRDVTVYLVSSDTTELQLPAQMILPAGSTSVGFDVTIADDNAIDGEQSVTLTARVPGWNPAVTVVRVIDDEAPVLSVKLPAAAVEGVGVLGGAGQVSIPGTFTNHVVVELTSSDKSELMVPAQVTIPVGQTNVGFSLLVVNDLDPDGPQTVTVTASAAGFSAGNGALIISDDEPLRSPLRFLSVESNGDTLELSLSTEDGSAVAPERAARVQLFAATDPAAPTEYWTPVLLSPVLTNGVLHFSGLSLTNASLLYFRAGETP